jgi:hypothetical protein
VVYFGGFFVKLIFFAGFSLYIINFVGRISEAAMVGAGEIIFHNLGALWKDTPRTVIFLSIYYSPERSAKLRWAGRGSGDIP